MSQEPSDPDAEPTVEGAVGVEALAGEDTFVGVVVGQTVPDPAPEGASDRLAVPEVLEVVGTLGVGGMGRVVEAREARLLRTVAVKTPLEPVFDAQLEREALVLSALEHPNIVPVYALKAGPQMVMRKIGGTGWNQLIHDPGAAGRAARGEDVLAFHIRVLMAVCDAVAHAHQRKILHRDLKPENVMVGEHGQIYLLDWGLAVSLDPDEPRPIPKAVDQKRITGTPAYMAPEQAGPGALTERTDVYGLGAILHEILTRTHRNPGFTVQDQLRAASAPVPVEYGSDADPLLGEIANRMTAARPADRLESAEAVREALVRWQQHRVSMDLMNRAKQQIKLMRQAFKIDGPTPLVQNLMADASATLRQALEIWPENARAQDTLQRLLKQGVEAQLTLGNLELAEDILAEIDDPGELEARLEVARNQQLSAQHDVESLRRFAQDNAYQVDGRRRRVVALLAMVVVGGLCVLLAGTNRLVAPVGYGAILTAVTVFVAVMGVSTAAILATGNRRSRYLGLQIGWMTVAVAAHWVGAAVTQQPIETALAWSSLVAGALLVTSGGTNSDRAAGFAGIPFALAFPAILVLPGLGWELFGVATGLAFAIWTALQAVVRDTDALT